MVEIASGDDYTVTMDEADGSVRVDTCQTVYIPGSSLAFAVDGHDDPERVKGIIRTLVRKHYPGTAQAILQLMRGEDTSRSKQEGT